MIKQWKDIKVGDVLQDGSVVTQIHRTHPQIACKVNYDNNKEFICSYNHVLLIDISQLPKEGKKELEEFCTFVPIEENLEIICNIELSTYEKMMIDRFCHNEPIPTPVDVIVDDEEEEIYDFHFNDGVKRIRVKNVITKSEPQKVDENTYWLTCKGIDYLMKKYKAKLYCNEMLINNIELVGKLPCFCISTNTGKYET